MKSKHGLSISLLLGLSLVFFWRVVLGQGTFFADDIILQNYPLRAYFAEGYRQGLIRLWCPELLCGFPLFAEGQAGPAYPGNFLFWLPIPFWLAFNWTMVGHVFLAGVLTYGYLVTLGCGRPSALLGAVVFMFSGWVIFRLHHTNMMNAVVWLPGLFWAVEVGFTSRPFLGFLAGGVALGCQTLAGHSQITVYSLLALVLYGLFHLGRVWRAAGNVRTGLQRVAGLGALFTGLWGVGAGLSAVQLIPLAELVRHNPRAGGLTLEIASEIALEIFHWPLFVAPYFYGYVFHRPPYWGPLLHWEYCAYLGIVPLVLSCFSVTLSPCHLVNHQPSTINRQPSPCHLVTLSPCHRWGARRRSYGWFFLALTMFAFLAAWGQALPLYRWLWHCPGFHSIRGPARLLCLWTFGLAILSGLGLDALIRGEVRWSSRQVKWFTLGNVGLLILGAFILWLVRQGMNDPAHPERRLLAARAWTIFLLLWLVALILVRSLLTRPAQRRLFALLVVGVAYADLVRVGTAYQPLRPPGEWENLSPAGRLLVARRGPFRLLAAPYSHPQLQADTNLLYGLENVCLYTPLYLRRHTELRGRLGDFSEPLLDLFNVKFVVARSPPGPSFRRFAEDHVYERTKSPLPRAWIVHEVEVIQDVDEVARRLRGGGFPLARKGMVPARSEEFSSLSPGKGPSQVKIKTYTHNRVRLAASCAGRSLLILGDTFYPGWRAYVDGRAVAVHCVDYVFRGVVLPPGEHEVTFVYQPLSFRLGLMVSLVTGSVLAALVTFRLLRSLNQREKRGARRGVVE